MQFLEICYRENQGGAGDEWMKFNLLYLQRLPIDARVARPPRWLSQRNLLSGRSRQFDTWHLHRQAITTIDPSRQGGKRYHSESVEALLSNRRTSRTSARRLPPCSGSTLNAETRFSFSLLSTIPLLFAVPGTQSTGLGAVSSARRRAAKRIAEPRRLESALRETFQ